MTSQRSDRKLAEWFLQGARVLPWRENASFYRVWISEIMLQQTQVVTVIPYFEKFLRLFPDVHALAAASEEDVMKAWAGLGYYSRARSLRKGALVLSARLKSGLDWPVTRDEWLEIPGVGPYTAGAILSIAGHLPEALLDGNVERVLSRFYCIDRSEGDSVYKENLWKRSTKWVVQAHRQGIDPSVTNQGLMELGARVCVPWEPRCGVCPIQNRCQAKKQGTTLDFPPKKARKVFLEVEETAYCFIDRRGRVLLEKSNAWRAGLWDLPLKHEGKGSLDFKTADVVAVLKTKHVVTRHRISRNTWIVKTAIPKNPPRSEFKWVLLKNLVSESPMLPLGSAAVKTLVKVSEQLRK